MGYSRGLLLRAGASTHAPDLRPGYAIMLPQARARRLTNACLLCRDEQGMELCSYADYCPDGGGMPPLGGMKRGDEWAPMADEPNRWVQVGLWGGSGANTCLAHDEVANGMKHLD